MISVIIPVYNSGKYLCRCIECVLSQDYTNWELILVDDGSQDDSGTISDKLADRDNRIRVIHQRNQGASVARQVGIAASNGEYLSFIDADDVVEADYLQKLYNVLIEKNTEVAACDFVRHREEEKVCVNCYSTPRILEYDELHKRFFKYEFWGFWGKIYKRDVFKNIYFPHATINEDYVVMAQLFHNCRHMAYIPIPLYHYMMHENSLSNQRLSARMMDEWENKKWVFDYYKMLDVGWCIPYAKILAAETCCKLIGAISNGGNIDEYTEVKHEMQHFLHRHLFSLLFSKQMLLGVKLMCLRRLLE